MKKTLLAVYVRAHFPIIAAALLSLIFAFASIHYTTVYASTSTTGRLYAWFACLENKA